MDWILPYAGLAVSVEGKDALFLRARGHPLMDWILPYEGLAVSAEGKDALFLKAECILLWIGYGLMRVWQFPLRGRMHSF